VYFVNVQDVEVRLFHSSLDQPREAGEDLTGQQLISGAIDRRAEIYTVR